MKRLSLLIVALCAFGAASAQEKAQGSGPSPYTECGIGAALFPNTAWAAGLSNAIWDLGSTAITSALASPETCNAKKVATARMILETLPDLEKDIVNGEGEYLASLQETMSCETGSAAAMNVAMREGYARYMSDVDYAAETTIDKAGAVYALVKTYVDASPQSCSVTL